MAFSSLFDCSLQLVVLGLFLFTLSNVASSISVDYNGGVVVINGTSYYAGVRPVAKLTGDIASSVKGDEGIIPLTVIHSTEPTFSKNHLDSILSKFAESDDVFQESFLKGTYM